jgi:hypothetical protein
MTLNMFIVLKPRVSSSGCLLNSRGKDLPGTIRMERENGNKTITCIQHQGLFQFVRGDG